MQVTLVDPNSSFTCSDAQTLHGPGVIAVRNTAKVKAALHGGILRRVNADDPEYNPELQVPELAAEPAAVVPPAETPPSDAGPAPVSTPPAAEAGAGSPEAAPPKTAAAKK